MTGGPSRLLIDLQAAQSVHYDRGVARWVTEHARALAARGAAGAMLLNPRLPFPRALDQDLTASPLLRWNTMSEVRAVAGGGAAAFVLAPQFEFDRAGDGDVPDHVLRSGLPLAFVLFDLIPLVMAERYLADPLFERRYRARLELLHQVDVVLAISEHTRRDAIRLLDLPADRVVNVGAGVSPFFRPAGAGEAPEAILARHVPQIRGPFAFVMTGGDPRKNVEGLIRAWALLAPDVRHGHQLVVSCSLDPGTRARWLAAAGDAGVGEGELVLTGWVPAEVQRALYQRCALLVHPSFYEGSWLPVGEAVACGAAAVTSSTTVLPEVLDWPESTFDPGDPLDIARVVERGLADPAFIAELRRRGAVRVAELTWDRVAGRTIDALSPFFGGSRWLAQRDPPKNGKGLPVRIALVGPTPPTASGIADYNERLLQALAGRCEVDVYSPGSRLARPDVPGVRWFPPPALRSAAASYDAVVYTAGNSDDHHDLYELAREVPGLLWLHDVRLPALYLTYAEDRIASRDEGDRFLEEMLRRQYRARFPEDLSRGVGTAWTHWTEHGLGATTELVSAARGVVVSSAVAARLLRLDQGPDAPTTPTWVVPLAAPVAWGDDARREPADRPLLVSFGVVSPVKGAELAIGALAGLRAAGVAAHLAFVGPVPDAYRADLDAATAAAGVVDHVTVAGRVGDETYRDWLARATVSLQLRTATNGESSAAVSDALAAGVPTVTNVAAATELPDGTVRVVPYDVDAATLAAILRELLADPADLAAMAAAGRAHATSWGFPQLADRLLDIVATLRPDR